MRGYLVEPPPSPRAAAAAGAHGGGAGGGDESAVGGATRPRRPPLALDTTSIDADGFLHTGDLVVVRPDGVFRIVGRLKELIKYKGAAVAPAELEAVLLAHPSIVDAAVVGVPDAAAGELPRAYVVLAPGADLPATAVEAWVHDRVAPHKRLRGGSCTWRASPRARRAKSSAAY
eukprot:TRINITY_DN3605_c0_g1_i3.p6 TRINITY_DN3605_c0_g1~~TRINITY_DN3605_c0_g1_i3.p6  ORF type:complete len:174 (-),score=61.36 TRINITY_DN3605_c0_g1_i3:889-1410(-)